MLYFRFWAAPDQYPLLPPDTFRVCLVLLIHLTYVAVFTERFHCLRIPLDQQAAEARGQQNEVSRGIPRHDFHSCGDSVGGGGRCIAPIMPRQCSTRTKIMVTLKKKSDFPLKPG